MVGVMLHAYSAEKEGDDACGGLLAIFFADARRQWSGILQAISGSRKSFEMKSSIYFLNGSKIPWHRI